MSGISGTATGAGEIGASGDSLLFEGVRGTSHAAYHGGVVGINDDPSDNAGAGVYGESAKGEGVRGISHSPFHGAIVGTCDNSGQGVFGESAQGEGVRGVSHSPSHGGVVGTNDHLQGVGVFGQGGRLAGQFEGAVEVTGALTVQGSDIVARIHALEAQTQANAALMGRIASLEARMNTLQGQLNALQNREVSDVSGIANSLITLAARVGALGG